MKNKKIFIITTIACTILATTTTTSATKISENISRKNSHENIINNENEPKKNEENLELILTKEEKIKKTFEKICSKIYEGIKNTKYEDEKIILKQILEQRFTSIPAKKNNYNYFNEVRSLVPKVKNQIQEFLILCNGNSTLKQKSLKFAEEIFSKTEKKIKNNERNIEKYKQALREKHDKGKTSEIENIYKDLNELKKLKKNKESLIDEKAKIELNLIEEYNKTNKLDEPEKNVSENVSEIENKKIENKKSKIESKEKVSEIKNKKSKIESKEKVSKIEDKKPEKDSYDIVKELDQKQEEIQKINLKIQNLTTIPKKILNASPLEIGGIIETIKNVTGIGSKEKNGPSEEKLEELTNPKSKIKKEKNEMESSVPKPEIENKENEKLSIKPKSTVNITNLVKRLYKPKSSQPKYEKKEEFSKENYIPKTTNFKQKKLKPTIDDIGSSNKLVIDNKKIDNKKRKNEINISSDDKNINNINEINTDSSNKFIKNNKRKIKSENNDNIIEDEINTDSKNINNIDDNNDKENEIKINNDENNDKESEIKINSDNNSDDINNINEKTNEIIEINNNNNNKKENKINEDSYFKKYLEIKQKKLEIKQKNLENEEKNLENEQKNGNYKDDKSKIFYRPRITTVISKLNTYKDELKNKLEMQKINSRQKRKIQNLIDNLSKTYLENIEKKLQDIEEYLKNPEKDHPSITKIISDLKKYENELKNKLKNELEMQKINSQQKRKIQNLIDNLNKEYLQNIEKELQDIEKYLKNYKYLKSLKKNNKFKTFDHTPIITVISKLNELEMQKKESPGQQKEIQNLIEKTNQKHLQGIENYLQNIEKNSKNKDYKLNKGAKLNKDDKSESYDFRYFTAISELERYKKELKQKMKSSNQQEEIQNFIEKINQDYLQNNENYLEGIDKYTAICKEYLNNLKKNILDKLIKDYDKKKDILEKLIGDNNLEKSGLNNLEKSNLNILEKSNLNILEKNSNYEDNEFESFNRICTNIINIISELKEKELKLIKLEIEFPNKKSLIQDIIDQLSKKEAELKTLGKDIEDAFIALKKLEKNNKIIKQKPVISIELDTKFRFKKRFERSDNFYIPNITEKRRIKNVLQNLSTNTNSFLNNKTEKTEIINKNPIYEIQNFDEISLNGEQKTKSSVKISHYYNGKEVNLETKDNLEKKEQKNFYENLSRVNVSKLSLNCEDIENVDNKIIENNENNIDSNEIIGDNNENNNESNKINIDNNENNNKDI